MEQLGPTPARPGPTVTLRQRYPSQEAEGTANERGDSAGQWPAVKNPIPHRARLRSPKSQDGPVRENHRHRQNDNENRHGLSHLQHHPIRLGTRKRRRQRDASGPGGRAPARKSAIFNASQLRGSAEKHSPKQRAPVIRGVQVAKVVSYTTPKVRSHEAFETGVADLNDSH